MNRTTRRRTVAKAAGLIASLALLASASSAFASENPHIVTWQLPSGAWSGNGDFFHLTDRSYSFSGPVKQSATFPQTLVGEGQLKPDCGEWAQVDFYKVTTQNQQSLYDSLVSGKVLGWNGGPADSSIYSGSQGYGFYFVYGGDCQQETTPPTEQPSQTPSEQPSEQPSATPSDCTCTEEPSATPSEQPSATPSDCTCTEEPSATPSEQPSETPSQQPTEEPSETPTGTVDAATGTPSITLPPTSTVDGAGPTNGGGGGLPLALFGLFGLTALIALVTPTPAKARRRIDRD